MTRPVCHAYARVRLAFLSPWQAANVSSDTPVLLGLSGGADSRLLLHLLADICQENGAALHVAHLHHGIRGEEADRDEAFCRALADTYGAVYHTLRVDVPAMAKQSGTSVEMAARDARYTFFSDIMRQHRIPLLLTAHHADDNLETVLLHLTRGCGLSGLGGIAPIRPFERVPNSVIVRPLLHCSKADILEACDALSLDFVLDSTNDDVAYDRNFMRSRVLPSLKELGGQAELRITRTCATLREDEEYLTQAADRFIEAHAEGDVLLREPLMTAHPAIGKRVLRLWILRLTGQLPESCHTERLWALCRENVSSRVIHLPGNYTVTVGKADLRIAKRSDAILNNSSLDEPLTMGTKDFLALGWQVTLLAKDEADISCEQHKKNTQVGKNVYNPFIRDTLTFDTILECDMQRLRWRGRREGDTLLWRGVHRKLRKLQNEVGIPVDLRDRLPLLCDGDRILWAPFIGAADGAFETATPSSAAFRLTIQAIPITDFSKEEAPL